MFAEVKLEERQRYIGDRLGEAGVNTLSPGLIHVPVDRSDKLTPAQYTCVMQCRAPLRYTPRLGNDQKPIQYTWTSLTSFRASRPRGARSSGYLAPVGRSHPSSGSRCEWTLLLGSVDGDLDQNATIDRASSGENTEASIKGRSEWPGIRAGVRKAGEVGCRIYVVESW